MIDYKVYEEQAAREAEQLGESLQRQQSWDMERPLEMVVADRGFAGKKISRSLEQTGIADMLCPPLA